MPESRIEDGMPTPWTMKIIKGLLHVFWIFSVSLIVTEILLQIFDPLDIGFYDAAGEYFSSRIVHTGHGFYINRPGDEYVIREGVSVSINERGFRGDNFAIEKTEGTIRVMCMGDSMAFGWGAPQDSLFPVALEKMAKEDGFPCEVINVSAKSWNTRMELNVLRKRGLLYEPDIMVLLVVGNDLLTPENASPRRRRFFQNVMLKRTGIRHSSLVRTYLHFQSKFLAGQEFIEQYERDPTVFDENILAIGEIVSVCRDNGIQLLIFLGVTGDGSSAFDQMYTGLYENELKKHGVKPVVCQAYFTDSALKVSPADPHASGLGHQHIAQAMYPELRSLLSEISEKKQ